MKQAEMISTSQEIFTDQNHIVLCGKVEKTPLFYRRICREPFYRTELSVPGRCRQPALVPVLLPGHLFDAARDLRGRVIRVTGQLRSYNGLEEGRKVVRLFVYAKEVEEVKDSAEGENEITLSGTLCKDPMVFRRGTASGITTLLLASNRSYGLTDYIPCVCRGRGAHFAAGFVIGQQFRIRGRFVSRKYCKEGPGNRRVQLTTYEVAVLQLEDYSCNYTQSAVKY